MADKPTKLDVTDITDAATLPAGTFSSWAKHTRSAVADKGTADSDLVITFRATRTPTGDPAHYPVPYFIASVLDGSNIQTKQILATTFDFNPGEASTTFSVTLE